MTKVQLIRPVDNPGELWLRVEPAGRLDLQRAVDLLARSNPDAANLVHEALAQGASVEYRPATHLHDDGSGPRFTDEFWILQDPSPAEGE